VVATAVLYRAVGIGVLPDQVKTGPLAEAGDGVTNTVNAIKMTATWTDITIFLIGPAPSCGAASVEPNAYVP